MLLQRGSGFPKSYQRYQRLDTPYLSLLLQ